MNPFFSSRISDCRGIDDIPQSIDTSKRCLDDRTLRSDTSYLINTHTQNNLTQHLNINHRTYQDNSHNGTFIIQNQNEILEDRNVSFVNCSFNQPPIKINNGGDEENPEQPDTPPQNLRQHSGRDIFVQQNREDEENIEEYDESNINNLESNMRPNLSLPFNLQQQQSEQILLQQQQQGFQQQQEQQQIQNRENSLFGNNREQNVIRVRQLLLQQRLTGDNRRSRNQQPESSQRQLFQISQFQSPSSQIQSMQMNSLQFSNELQLQRLNASIAQNRNYMAENSERRRNNRQNQIQQNNQLNNSDALRNNIQVISQNNQSISNQNQSRSQQNAGYIRNSNGRRRDVQQEQDQQQENGIENIEIQEQERQIEQLNQIIRNSRRRMQENRQNNRQNQIHIGGRHPQVVEIDEEDKLRAKLVFKKAFTHLVALTVFSIFLLSVFYINLLMEGLWLILFFISCFFTGNKLSFYKNLSEDFYFEFCIKKFIQFIEFDLIKIYREATYEEKRQAFFDIVEYIFMNVLIFMIFLFFKLINQPITLLFVYTPFVHIIWWLVFTSKTQESMNRHIELLLRIYAITQAILFAVQYDDIVKWSWVSIFLPSWILLSSLGFYIFGLSVLFFCSLYYCLIGQTDKYQIKGLIWCLLVSIYIVGGSLFFLLGLMDYFETNNLNLLRYSSATLIAGSALSTIYSVACSHDLEIFIALANSENLFNGAHQVQVEQRNNQQQNEQQENDQNQNQNQEAQQMNFFNQIANFSQVNRAEDLQPKKIKIIRTTKAIPRNIPQFLIRFSSTYFQQSDVNRELVILLQKKNMELIKKQDEKKKKDKQDNKNSSSKQQINSNKKINNKQNSQNFNKDEESNSKEKEEKESIQGQRSFVKEEKLSNRSRQESKLTSQPSTQQCLVCFDNSPDSVILECGHGGLCNTCALDIWKKTGECYLCRQTISKILGKYKQIIAVSNMHEVSHDQDDIVQPISELVIQQNNQLQIYNNEVQNINQQNDQPFEIQLNNELQLAEQQQQQQLNEQQQQQQQNEEQQQLYEEQQEQQISQSQNQIQIQENQQEQYLQQQRDKEEDIEDQDKRQIIEQDQQIQDENKIELEKSLKKGEDEDENIGVIEYNDDDDNSESNERQQYQESTAMRVTLSQYTNNQNQKQGIPSSMFELDTYIPIIINKQNEKKKCSSNKNSYPSSQKILSVEQLQNQLKQIDDLDQYSDLKSVSSYHDQCNTIKNPNYNKSQQNLQKREESTIFESASHQKITFDENINHKTYQDQPLSIINSNLAQPIPIQLCKVNLNSNDKHSLKQKNASYEDQQNIENNNNSQYINSQNRNQNENKQIINSYDNMKQITKNQEVQECDIEETQQSTNRSQTQQQKSANKNNKTNKFSEKDKEHLYRYQNDEIKIQTLDKLMSKYFDSANLDNKETYMPNQQQVEKKQDTTNEKVVQENIQFNKSYDDDVIKLSDEDESNDCVPSIKRIDHIINKENNLINYPKDHLKSASDDILIIQNQLNETDTDQQQLSTMRVDKDKDLIQFDESEDQLDQN